MLICYKCEQEINLPGPNVRFKKPGLTDYRHFHNSDQQPCWKEYMLEAVKKAKLEMTLDTAKIQSIEAT